MFDFDTPLALSDEKTPAWVQCQVGGGAVVLVAKMPLGSGFTRITFDPTGFSPRDGGLRLVNLEESLIPDWLDLETGLRKEPAEPRKRRGAGFLSGRDEPQGSDPDPQPSEETAQD